MQELLESGSKQTKTYKLMSESELKKEATKLSKDDNKYIADVGKSILTVLARGAYALEGLLSAVNVIIFIAPATLAYVLTVVISTFLYLAVMTPPVIIGAALTRHRKLLKSIIKKYDEPTKQYFNAIDDIIKGKYIMVSESSGQMFSATLESLADWSIILEAPDKDDEPTDYTKEVDNDDEKDEAKDYTEDVTTDNEPEVEDEGESTEDEPTDYTEEVEGEGDTTDDTDETTDDTTEDDTTNDTSSDNTNDENTTIKNYNLLVDFQSMHKTIGEILNSLHDIVYSQPIQNQILTKGINNLQEIRSQIERYINYSFSEDYKKNVYYYTVYLQASKMNLEMLRKNYQLGKE